MHNPTRRVKRFKRPLSSTRPLYQLPETTTQFDEENPTTWSSSNTVRHRQATQPDALRSATLVALIVITIVLYVLLWELERSPFASQPISNLNWSVMATPPSSGGTPKSGATSTRHLPAVFLNGPVSAPGEESKPFDDRLPSSTPGHTTRDAWPPPITRLPEEHDIDDPAKNVDDRTRKDEDTKSSSSFDPAYCNGGCRFLFPARIGEQESKARVHFTQLLTLARQLNRTIVLPNVGKSRMSACSKWPFGMYYDTTGFAREGESPGSWLAIELGEFAKWVDERPAPASSLVVSMKSMPRGHHGVLGTPSGSEGVPFIVEKDEVDPKILSCLESKFARLPLSPDTALSISFDSGSLKTEANVATHLVQLLSNSLDMNADSDLDLMTGPGYEYAPLYTNSSRLSLADIHVLVLDYDLRYPLFATPVRPNFNLHYAPALYDIADRLSDNLGPFLGVHWRMENAPVQNLAWCAASLVSALRTLLQDDASGKNVRHVWLATDHPRPLSSFTDGVRFPVDDGDDDGEMSNGIGSGVGSRSTLRDYGPLRKSSTFSVLSSEHDAAIETLAEAFRPGGDLEGWRLTDLSEQLSRYPYVEGRFDVNEALLGDSGVFGILDKLVVVQATAFVSGSTDCSKTSSFSKQVIEVRQELFEAERGKGAIRNVVEYFGKW